MLKGVRVKPERGKGKKEGNVPLVRTVAPFPKGTRGPRDTRAHADAETRGGRSEAWGVGNGGMRTRKKKRKRNTRGVGFCLCSFKKK